VEKHVQRPRPLAGRLEKIQPMPFVHAVGHIRKRGRGVDGAMGRPCQFLPSIPSTPNFSGRQGLGEAQPTASTAIAMAGKSKINL
jgi:hypothetical protein